MRSFLCALLLFPLATLAAQTPAPAKKKEDSKAASNQQQTAQPPPAQPQQPPKPAEPRQRSQTGLLYDGTGRPIPGAVGAREERHNGVVERRETMLDATGRPVVTRATEERVLSSQGDNKTSERVVQRYDLNGRPTTKQVIRIETRRVPDGSLVTTETMYEQDLNGRLQFTERKTTTETKTATGGMASTVVERPSLQGGALQVVERTDRVDTKKSENVTESVSTVRQIDPNGRLDERKREATITVQNGDVTTKETKQWELQPTGKLEFVGRSKSNITTRPDGSQVEDTEVYTTRIAGTTPDLNQPGVPTLEQRVHREKVVQANGQTVEKTTARIRTVAEPTRLGGLVVTEQVSKPTADGASVETSISERDSNGRMVLVQRSVEDQKK